MLKKKVYYGDIADLIDQESAQLPVKIRERVGPFSYDRNLKSLLADLSNNVEKMDYKGKIDPHAENVLVRMLYETHSLINLCNTSDWPYGQVIASSLATGERESGSLSIHNLRKKIMQESQNLYDSNLTTQSINEHLTHNGQALARFAARAFRDFDRFPQVMEAGSKLVSACKSHDQKFDAGMTA